MPSVTEHVPLVGADGYLAMRNLVPELGRQTGLAPWRVEHLLGRYGSLLTEVLALADGDRSLLEPMPSAQEYLQVELRYGATHEAALHLEDLLARRTRMSIETRHRGWTPRRWRRRWSRTCSAGTRPRSPGRWRPTPPGWRPSAAASCSPTTRPATPRDARHPSPAGSAQRHRHPLSFAPHDF